MSIRECAQCSALKPSGLRCTRTTCKYPGTCWQHTMAENKLEIKRSAIPDAGDGLFALKRFRRGDPIATFGGQVVSTSAYEESPSVYGIHLNGTLVLDSASTQAGLARYANNCTTTDRRANSCPGNNARIVVNARTRTARLEATKTIEIGQEVFAAYGSSYGKRARR